MFKKYTAKEFIEKYNYTQRYYKKVNHYIDAFDKAYFEGDRKKEQ